MYKRQLLAFELEPQDGQVHEVGAGVGQLPGGLESALAGGAVPGLPVRPHPVHGDGDQPGPETLVRPQGAQPVERPQHRVLHHVVHVDGAVQGAPDDVVDERQVGADQLVLRAGIARAGGCHQRCRVLCSHVRFPVRTGGR